MDTAPTPESPLFHGDKFSLIDYAVQIQHSYPLSAQQKLALAQAITKLHSSYFLTPLLYVNVNDIPSEPAGDYFLAGKPMLPASANRITVSVRTSPSRTKEMFDDVALQVEAIWYDIVHEQQPSGKLNGHHDTSKQEKKAKKLHGVAFQGIISAAENGILLPSVSARRDFKGYLQTPGKTMLTKTGATGEP